LSNKEKKELLELLKSGDCPAELLDLLDSSESKWRKGVIKEFIGDHLWKKGIDKDVSQIKKIVWGIFTVTIIATLAQFFLQYVIPFIGV